MGGAGVGVAGLTGSRHPASAIAALIAMHIVGKHAGRSRLRVTFMRGEHTVSVPILTVS